MSNQVKLAGAITGRQNRAFFGRSGCRILNVGGVCLALGVSGRIVMIREVGVTSCMLNTAPRGRRSTTMEQVYRCETFRECFTIGPFRSVLPHAGRHHYICRACACRAASAGVSITKIIEFVCCGKVECKEALQLPGWGASLVQEVVLPTRR